MSQKKKVLIFENSFALSEHLLKMWIDIAQESIARQNRFTVALSGGRSPMEFYSKLSAYKDFDLWSRTHIFLADERFVPHDHNSSNFKMIKENLLDYVAIPGENIHPIDTNHKNVDLAADHYKQDLAHFFEFKGNAPCFDLIILGVGDNDGHTASLFPNDENIHDPARLILPVSLPHLKEERISLGFPVINNARNVASIILGPNKADIVDLIFNKKSKLPITQVDPLDGCLTHLIGRDAAQKLPYQNSEKYEGSAVVYEGGI